ncbi:hypothetical protein FA95DRAFT_1578915, partial [Auriscalpium vulgare]
MPRLPRIVLKSSSAYSERLKKACFAGSDERKPPAATCMYCAGPGRLGMTFKPEHAGHWHAVCFNSQCPWRSSAHNAKRTARAWYPPQVFPTADQVAVIENIRRADALAKAALKLARAQEAKHLKPKAKTAQAGQMDADARVAASMAAEEVAALRAAVEQIDHDLAFALTLVDADAGEGPDRSSSVVPDSVSQDTTMRSVSERGVANGSQEVSRADGQDGDDEDGDDGAGEDGGESATGGGTPVWGFKNIRMTFWREVQHYAFNEIIFSKRFIVSDELPSAKLRAA